MKILAIRFKNLNSLVGEWQIDLTRPEFLSDGIFAIIGPTGAGKTTILDAICLALYGRTPRLNKIGKNGNEIMSRQMGECFSEVVFETQSGRYRCYWGQHRSRKKPAGELQNPKHEISEASSGRVIEAKLRTVAGKIEQVTGMDFDRFTRSMLLAQGGFAAFLQASPDDRAPILEQITGTEIYSHISIRVHEKWADERKKLDVLQSELAGMQLLNEDEEQQLKADLAQKLVQESELSKELENKAKALAWLDRIVQLEHELKELDEKRKMLSLKQKKFEPDLKKLDAAKRALELSGQYAGLISMRLEQDADLLSINECKQNLPKLEAKVIDAEKKQKSALKALSKNRQEEKSLTALVKTVRELDFQLKIKDSEITDAEKIFSETENLLNSYRKNNNKDRSDLDVKENEFNQLTYAHEKTAMDAGLIEHLTGIQNRFDGLRGIAKNKQHKQEEMTDAEVLKLNADKLSNEKAEKYFDKKKSLELIQNSYNKKKLELLDVLAGKEISTLRTDVLKLNDRIALLEVMLEYMTSLDGFRKMIEGFEERKLTLSKEKLSLDSEIDAQIEKQFACEREMQLVETQLILLKQIQSYENARKQLQDGESCPLCGAEDHPFAEGNIPRPDSLEIELKHVKARVKKINEALFLLNIKHAETEKDLTQIATRQREIFDEILSIEKKISKGLMVLSLADVSNKNLNNALQELLNETSVKLRYASGIIQAVDEFEKELVDLRESLDKTKDAAAASKHEAQVAKHKKEMAEQTFDRLKQEFKMLSVQLQKSEKDALDDVIPFEIHSLDIDSLDSIQDVLTRRRDQRISLNEQLIGLEKEISGLHLQTKYQQEQIQKTDLENKKQKIHFDKLKRERSLLFQKRYEIFSDKCPNVEEERLSLAIETSEKLADEFRHIFNTETQALMKLKTQAEAIEKVILARGKKLQAQEIEFRKQLDQSNFVDEASYQSACLPEDERKQLMSTEQKLVSDQAALDGRYQDRLTLLNIEREKEITDQQRTPLAAMLETLRGNLKELQQTLGGIRQKLADNENLRAQQQVQAQAVDRQKKSCERWGVLHELIGSADGKKYRNFAQGLTFEMMIGHANRQLQKMTDRYLLIRDDALPLELNVVDNYQGGEIRSTKNLSGGEGFIVSLALALGLSHMASKNVRVDSLFLDEGFGTLDEEALDTALETLAGLQQEGKLIGVISHVSTLKERISTQIQVTPDAGGRSVISGPGCLRVLTAMS